MKRETIAVDIDDVLSPMRNLVFMHHNEVYGTDIPIEGPGSYFFSDYTNDSYDVIEEKLKRFIETDAFKNNQPLEDAVAVIKHLEKTYDIFVVTSRQDFYYDITHSWLTQHFPDVFKAVHFTSWAGSTSLKVPKSQICIENKASYLIDDNLDFALEAAQAGLEVLLFGDYPWNIQEKLPPAITRVKNWQAVKRYFDAKQQEF